MLEAPTSPDAGASPIGTPAAPVVETPGTGDAAHLHMVTPVIPEVPKQTPVAPAKEDPTRFEYHQRRADLAEGKAKQLEPLAELGRKVMENPELMALVSGRTQAPAAPAPTAPPKPPVKPASYNEEEAYNDPRSESFRYRVAREQYRDELLATMAEREAQREARMQEQQRAREEAALIERNTAAFKAQLQHQYGLSATEADDLIATLGDPSAVQPTNLVKLYKLIKQERQAAQSGGGTPPANLGPIPPTFLGGENRSPMTEGDNFNNALLKYKRK